MGATTIWERWNGIRPDSTFEPASMNSFNHYAYGAIGDWMYRSVAGIDTDEDGPGYKKITIKPHIGKGLTNAAATVKTYYGELSSSWKAENGTMVLHVIIPANTTATIYIPAKDATLVWESGKLVAEIKDVKVLESKDGYVKVNIGSGDYKFIVN